MNRLQFLIRPADDEGKRHFMVGYGECADAFNPGRSALQIASSILVPMAFEDYAAMIPDPAIGAGLLKNRDRLATDFLEERVFAHFEGFEHTATLICDQVTGVAVRSPHATFVFCGVANGKDWSSASNRICNIDLRRGKRGELRMQASSVSEDLGERLAGIHPAKLLREPIWGFGPTRFTLPQPQPLERAAYMRRVREADLRELVGVPLTAMERRELDLARSNPMSARHLPTFRARNDPGYGVHLDMFMAYNAAMHANGLLLDRPESLTAEAAEGIRAISRRIVNQLSAPAPAAQLDGPHPEP